MEDVQNFAPVRVKLATEYDVQNCNPVIRASIDSPIIVWDAEQATVDTSSSSERYYTQPSESLPSGVHFSNDSHLDPPSGSTSWVTEIPDMSGSRNELHPAGGETRPHMIDDTLGAISGKVVEFCNINYSRTASQGLSPQISFDEYQDSHLLYSDADLVGKSYTMFAIIRKPSALVTDIGYSTSIVNAPVSLVERSLTSIADGGFLFFNPNGQGLFVGPQDNGDIHFGHGGTPAVSTDPAMPLDQFVVLVVRYNAEAGEAHIFINNVSSQVISVDTPLSPAAALPWIGARLTADDGGGRSVAYQMRLVEVYEGAVLTPTIEAYTTDLRNQYNF